VKTECIFYGSVFLTVSNSGKCNLDADLKHNAALPVIEVEDACCWAQDQKDFPLS
jgi:hypothetical protein